MPTVYLRSRPPVLLLQPSGSCESRPTFTGFLQAIQEEEQHGRPKLGPLPALQVLFEPGTGSAGDRGGALRPPGAQEIRAGGFRCQRLQWIQSETRAAPGRGMARPIGRRSLRSALVSRRRAVGGFDAGG